jgi:uncharacterized protein involved in exopolysaccharide biosynthesis
MTIHDLWDIVRDLRRQNDNLEQHIKALKDIAVDQGSQLERLESRIDGLENDNLEQLERLESRIDGLE